MSDVGPNYEYYNDDAENNRLDGEFRIWRGIGPYEGHPTVILKNGRGYIPPLNRAKNVMIVNWVFEPSLHEIGIYLPNMPNVEELIIEECPGIFNINTLFMPKLKKLIIHKCGNLEKIKVNNLDKLHIRTCNKLDSVKVGGKVKKLHIDETTVTYIEGIIDDLCLISCNSIALLRNANILNSIFLRSCSINELPPELIELRELHLLLCHNITIIPEYPNIVSLTLVECLGVRKIQLPKTPKKLIVDSCPNLTLSSV